LKSRGKNPSGLRCLLTKTRNSNVSVGAINAYLHEKKVGLPARSIVFLEDSLASRKSIGIFIRNM
jgi:hypothetical protein